MASTVVFGTVLADAALVSRVIQLDACEAPPARFAAPASAPSHFYGGPEIRKFSLIVRKS